MVLVMSIGRWSAGAIQQGRKGMNRCRAALISLSVCFHSTSDHTEKGNGSSALYLIIYSLFRRISASIAKTIVLTILRFLDFAFAR